MHLPQLVFGVMTACALLWPARLVAPLDGIPLDGRAEAIFIGLVFPALWWLFPRFLDRRPARALVVALLAWKVLLAATVTQDGWCIRFNPPAPITNDARGAPHGWDLRADWRSPDPACSAIVARRYEVLEDFPAWFFNLPPPGNGWPGSADRPPGAKTRMSVTGVLRAAQPGVLTIAIGDNMVADIAVDGLHVAQAASGTLQAPLPRGVHAVDVTGVLFGDQWRFAPEWRGRDLWGQSVATVGRPSAIDRLVRPWGRFIAPLLVAALLTAWLLFAFRTVADPDLVAWAIAASCWFGVLAATGHGDMVRASVPFLGAAVFARVPRRLQNTTGLFFLVGVPWLTMIACLHLQEIGRFRLYEAGNDYWTFQRAAYRIVMQGYWLEGGSPTFWFQPLYRWFAGLLHVVFGDSSVGELYWDAAWILVGALFSFQVTRGRFGFRWGAAAAVTTLTLIALGTPRQHIGRGLSEITSAGLLSLAALLAMRSRHRQWRFALAAGVLATLAFYTRLNNLPMAFGAAAFALPARLPASALFRPLRFAGRVSWRTVSGVVGTLFVALLLFAWRTWHYTGVFSVTYGTQAKFLAVWKPGMAPAAVLQAMASSVMMVLTMHDPPRLDALALPVTAGAAVAVLAIAGVPRLKTIPLAPAVFCIAGLAGALVSRGSAYEGRFSIHIVPVAAALFVCAIASASDRTERRGGPARSDTPARGTGHRSGADK